MVLREQILEAARRKEHEAKLESLSRIVIQLPTSRSDEKAIDALMENKRTKRKATKIPSEDSERLKRIERMLVEVLKKIEL